MKRKNINYKGNVLLTFVHVKKSFHKEQRVERIRKVAIWNIYAQHLDLPFEASWNDIYYTNMTKMIS